MHLFRNAENSRPKSRWRQEKDFLQNSRKSTTHSERRGQNGWTGRFARDSFGGSMSGEDEVFGPFHRVFAPAETKSRGKVAIAPLRNEVSGGRGPSHQARALHECVAHRRSPSPDPSPRDRGERATAFPRRRAFPAGQRRPPSPSPRRGEGARRADEGVPGVRKPTVKRSNRRRSVQSPHLPAFPASGLSRLFPAMSVSSSRPSISRYFSMKPMCTVCTVPRPSTTIVVGKAVIW